MLIFSCEIQLFYWIPSYFVQVTFIFSFSETIYLCKGHCWQSGPIRYPAGNCGSALYVPPVKCVVCSFVHNSYICVVCQLKGKTFKGENIHSLVHRQKE